MKSVQADVFLLTAAEDGLFPKPGFFSQYLQAFPLNRITLDWFEQRPYIIRRPRQADLPVLDNLEAACWLESLRASPDEIQQRIEYYPDDHFVLEMHNQVMGVIYSQRISSIDQLKSVTTATVSSLHTEQGTIIQLLSLNVFPKVQGMGLGDQLLEFMLQFCTLQEGVESVVAVTRCKNYLHHPAMSLVEYIYARNEQGFLLDPILRLHEAHGATIEGIVSQYRPNDTDNQGHGILVAYDLSNRFLNNETSAIDETPATDESPFAIVVEAIRAILGRERQSAFSHKRPLMEMGLDSLNILELRLRLNQRFGAQLEPMFFFQHSTPQAISDYFEGKESPRSHAPALERLPVRSASPAQLDVERPVCTPTQDDAVKLAAHSGPPTPPERGIPLLSPPFGGTGGLNLTPLPTQKRVNEGLENAVAIIGMACRFPNGANSLDEYWSHLRDGIDAITTVPSTRWDIERYYDPDRNQPGKMVTRYGGFLDQVDRFDAAFFRIAPREAVYIDPQHRILLETSWTALEHAGLNPEALAGTQTGVFIGLFTHDYETLQVKQNQADDFAAYFATGNSASVAAGRLAYFYGFQGPAMAIDTACSSSLVAVHQACQSLRLGECNLALAGGVNLLLSPALSITFSRAGMLSEDGRCKTFDASADGYVRSEGCGLVVLKRLSDALADNDNILAVVQGSAVNQDGTSTGLIAPNQSAQEAVIRQALAVAGVAPREISYVETHGTGTALGDPVEVKALAAVYGQERPTDNPLAIGSVKTNIGHTEAAAGIAGLIKVVLALQHETIPPHLHFKSLNPHITLNQIPAIIPTENVEWPASDRPRLG